MRSFSLGRVLAYVALGLVLVTTPGAGAAAAAAEIRVAVAANFSGPARVIAEAFTAETGIEVVLIFGSTGKIYAQIANGAPFDLFLAADARRPELLEKNGLAISGSRVTYARGRLVLWSPDPSLIDSGPEILQQAPFRHLAIANPKLAPYGQAALEALEALDLWSSVEELLVRGENISQAFAFVSTGNAELGFVAYSQVFVPGHRLGGSTWIVPQSLHLPIEQQAVLLSSHPEARSFLDFLVSEEAGAVIRSYGYETP